MYFSVSIPLVWQNESNFNESTADVEEFQQRVAANEFSPFSCSPENKNSSESSPSNQHYHEHSYDLGDEDEWFSPTEIISTPTNVRDQRDLSS
jgi:hypothetical protein